jgi:hypothetical protein
MMLPFSFTYIVPEAEVRTGAERFEAQAGSLPWFDWLDFCDDAGAELLEELRGEAKRLNMREHEFERDWSVPIDGMRITCSFINETEMVVFRLAI